MYSSGTSSHTCPYLCPVLSTTGLYLVWYLGLSLYRILSDRNLDKTDNLVTISAVRMCDNRFFGLGKHFCKNLGNSGCGEVPDLLQGITVIDVNSGQNLGPTISF